MSAWETVRVFVTPSSSVYSSSVYSKMSFGRVTVLSTCSLLSASTSVAASQAKQASSTERLTQKTKYMSPPRQPVFPSRRGRMGI